MERSPRSTCSADFIKLGCKGRRAGDQDDLLRHGRLVISQITKKPSQLQENIKQRAGVENILPQPFSYNEVILSDGEEGHDRIQP